MTVLNTIELTTQPGWPIVLSVMSLIAFGISLAFLLTSCDSNVLFTLNLLATIATLGCFLYFGIEAPDYAVPSGKYRYEVILNENVSFHEIASKYDIIEQRGEIFVLEEKEDA